MVNPQNMGISSLPVEWEQNLILAFSDWWQLQLLEGKGQNLLEAPNYVLLQCCFGKQVPTSAIPFLGA